MRGLQEPHLNGRQEAPEHFVQQVRCSRMAQSRPAQRVQGARTDAKVIATRRGGRFFASQLLLLKNRHLVSLMACMYTADCSKKATYVNATHDDKQPSRLRLSINAPDVAHAPFRLILLLCKRVIRGGGVSSLCVAMWASVHVDHRFATLSKLALRV